MARDAVHLIRATEKGGWGASNPQGLKVKGREQRCMANHRITYCFFAEQGKKAGTVTSLAWTPDGCALAMTWSKGGIAVWSVFGALLTCTLQSDFWYVFFCIVSPNSIRYI